MPLVAKALHEKNLPTALERALQEAGLQSVSDIDVAALATGPGLGPCLRAGLEFTKQELNAQHGIPILSVHHMEAHALMPRMTTHVRN